jgi:hypothetical protein
MTATALLTGATAATAMPPPWSYVATYGSYDACTRQGSQLLNFGVVQQYICNIDAVDTPERNLWVIWS